MTEYYNIYIAFLIFVSITFSYFVFRTKYVKSTLLSISLFIHRYGIFIPKLMRSIQISIIVIPIYTISNLIELIRKVPKKNRTTQNLITQAVKEYGKDKFIKWLSVLLLVDITSLVWADNLLLGLVGVATRILMFLTAFNVYVALKISQKHIHFIIEGLSVGIILNTILAVLQRIDCTINHCATFLNIDHNILKIRGLSLTEQAIGISGNFFPRTIGLFGDVNMHSFFINACILILFGKLVSIILSKKESKKGKIIKSILLITIILFAIITSITSFSRSAIMGIIIPVLYIFVFVIISESIKRKSFKPILITLLLTSVFVLISLIIYPKVIQNENVKKYGQSLIGSRLDVEQDSSAMQHFYLIRNALRIGTKATFGWGTGIGNYHNFYNKYIDESVQNTDPHSWFALLYAEQGWLGITFYLTFFIYYIFWAVITSIRNLSKTEYISLCIKFIPLTFIIGMIYYYGFFTPMVWFWFGLAMFYIEKDKKTYNLSLNSVTVFILIAFITIYQKFFSFDHAFWANPDKFRICIFHPSCSEYMKESLQKKGAIRGVILGVYRIIRCNPFNEGGLDPVK